LSAFDVDAISALGWQGGSAFADWAYKACGDKCNEIANKLIRAGVDDTLEEKLLDDLIEMLVAEDKFRASITINDWSSFWHRLIKIEGGLAGDVYDKTSREISIKPSDLEEFKKFNIATVVAPSPDSPAWR